MGVRSPGADGVLPIFGLVSTAPKRCHSTLKCIGMIFWVKHHSTVSGFSAEGLLGIRLTSSVREDHEWFPQDNQRHESRAGLLEVFGPPLQGPLQFGVQVLEAAGRMYSSSEQGEGDRSHSPEGLGVGEHKSSAQLGRFSCAQRSKYSTSPVVGLSNAKFARCACASLTGSCL